MCDQRCRSVEVAELEREQVITSNPEVLGGTTVFAGTRVPVQTLIDYLKAGDSLNDFLDGFPSVSREQAEAFLQLALNSTLLEGDARSAG
jgi:uncharacterized protein (DUF433 family)